MMVSMARPISPRPDDPVQSQRFRDLAADLELEDGDEHAVERAVKRLAQHPRTPKPSKRRPKKS
jgi:hypothetical protein